MRKIESHRHSRAVEEAKLVMYLRNTFVLVTFLVIATKYLTEAALMEERFILAHVSGRFQSMVGKVCRWEKPHPWQQELEAIVTHMLVNQETESSHY